MKRPETKLYAKWVTEEIKRNRAAFDGYNQGKGIIGTRERFLKWMESGGPWRAMWVRRLSQVVTNLGKRSLSLLPFPGAVCHRFLILCSMPIYSNKVKPQSPLRCRIYLGSAILRVDDIKAKKTCPGLYQEHHGAAFVS